MTDHLSSIALASSSSLAMEGLPILLAEEGFGRFFGRMHPILVHFPIALLVVAAIVEFWRLLVARLDRPTPFSSTAIAFAAIAALLASSTGWLNAEHESAEEGRTLFLHRWLGIAVVVLSLGLLLVASQARAASSRREPSRAMTIFRLGLFGTAILVGAVGHLGGEMVYGENYLLKAWPSGDEGDAEHEPRSTNGSPNGATNAAASTVAAGGAAGDGVDGSGAAVEVTEVIEVMGVPLDPAEIFASAVLPAMQARCVECHGPDKSKAGLRLDSLEAVLAGAKGEAVVVAGDPDASELIHRVMLPRDAEEAMPPSGDGLTEAEISAIRAWIESLPGAG